MKDTAVAIVDFVAYSSPEGDVLIAKGQSIDGVWVNGEFHFSAPLEKGDVQCVATNTQVASKNNGTREHRGLSYGERAVGLTFNPSGSGDVYGIKSDFASIIDQIDGLRNSEGDPEVKRLCSIAITDAQSACMWAVKALTWGQP